MSEYYMTHTGKELDDAINKVKSGYILPSETINITSNVSNKDITNGKILNVNVPVPDGYVKFNKYYTETYTPSGSSLVLSKTFTCGFQPKVILIVPKADTTFSTTYGEVFSAYISIGAHGLIREGLYKLSGTNRFGQSSGGIGSLTATGFTFSHASFGFMPGISYDVFVWGEA